MSFEPIYEWVDQLPLTRVRKNFARDFSDGCMVAEVIKHFRPSIVEIHNYRESLSAQRKKENWVVLNQKVLKKLGIDIGNGEIDQLCNGTDKAAEKLLARVKASIDDGVRALPKKKAAREPEARQMENNPKNLLGPKGGRGAGGAIDVQHEGPSDHESAKAKRSSPEQLPQVAKKSPEPPKEAWPAKERHPPSEAAHMPQAKSPSARARSPAAGDGQGARDPLEHVRRMILEMANYNLSQFDLHSNLSQLDLHGNQGPKDHKAQRSHAEEASPRHAWGEKRAASRIPHPPKRTPIRGEPHVVQGRREVVAPSVERAGGRERDQQREAAANRDAPARRMAKFDSQESSAKELSSRVGKASPLKSPRKQRVLARGQAPNDDDEDYDFKSRDLMREAAIALAEVRNTFSSLEASVKELEVAARMKNIIPPMMDSDLGQDFDMLGEDGGRDLSDHLHQHPWTNPRADAYAM